MIILLNWIKDKKIIIDTNSIYKYKKHKSVLLKKDYQIFIR